VTYTGSLIGLNYLWYNKNEQRSFHFFNDNKQWQQLDKIGHFYTAFHLSRGTNVLMNYASMEEKKAQYLSSFIGFMLLTPIEILDGFSATYGASLGDLAANASGSLFYLTQELLWNEIRVKPKFSYQPSEFAHQNPDLLGSGFQEELFKDYNGQTYWLSFDLYSFLNDNSKFPKWLNIAIGYGGSNMVNANVDSNVRKGLTPFRQYYLAIDPDLSHIKSNRRVIKALIFVADIIKMPAPTIYYQNGNWNFRPLYF
jgi:hypothetical protein